MTRRDTTQCDLVVLFWYHGDPTLELVLQVKPLCHVPHPLGHHVEVLNSQLDSSLVERPPATEADPQPRHVCPRALLEDGENSGKVPPKDTHKYPRYV